MAWNLTRWLFDLRKRKYDLVFDLQGLGRSGLFALFTLAPWRVGFRDARELGWLGVNVHVERGERRHTVDQMLHLVESQGVRRVADLRLHPPPERVESWHALRRDLSLQGPFAVLAPTSRWRCKQWPAERWAELASRVLARGGVERVVVVGAPGEEAQTRWARDVEQCVDLCGRLRVGETMAVIQDAAVLVANDSAPLHMAVGLGTPYVGLFGPTDPERVGPYRGERWVVRASLDADERRRSYRALGDDDSIMRRIEAAEVFERLAQAMESRAWFLRVAEGVE
ncbi:MAG: glycosyltransferase family 9 protein [Phycisphaeraceae bacterium]|nr:glycosyltransferase family 9 protein [Phycisphaeraceae bacterium]